MFPELLTQVNGTVLAGGALAAVAVLGLLPGRVARRRGHPQADAIRITGWLSVFTFGLTLPVALIWAFTKPNTQPSLMGVQEDVNDLWSEVKDLRLRVDLIEQIDRLNDEHDE